MSAALLSVAVWFLICASVPLTLASEFLLNVAETLIEWKLRLEE